jgi:nicotinamidase-related amidase
MRNIVNLRSYAGKAIVPTLVLLDLQEEYIASPRLFALPDVESALQNCRVVLRHSRRAGLPIAFVRMVGRSVFFKSAPSHSGWISGFEPEGSDMVFERNKPSCYASREFANAMTAGGGHFVLAGFSGEEACLATVIEAFHRNHRVTFLADASASHGLDRTAPRSVHDMVVQLIGLFGEVTGARQWISEQTSGAALRAH